MVSQKKEKMNQKGIVHIIPLIAVIILIAAALFWFFTTKQNVPSSFEEAASLKFKPFKDISTDDKNYAAIAYLAREGIVEADKDGKFNPKDVISRAGWTVILVKLTGIIPDVNVYKNCFSDVGQGMDEAFICFAKEQGWLGGFGVDRQTLNIWQFISTVNAQGESGKFNPDAPVKTAEAAGSLSRLMKWEDNGQAVNFAKDRKIIEDSKTEDNLTKGDAAGIIHRSLATVPLGNNQFSPKLEHQIERYKIENLIDLDEKLISRRDKVQEQYRKERQRKMAKVIGEEAAAEIMKTAAGDSNVETDLYRIKKREKNYEKMLAEEKAVGKEDPSFNVLEPLQKVFADKGIALSKDNVLIYKGVPPHYETRVRIDDNPVTNARDGATISLFLDENYNILLRANAKRMKYVIRITLGGFYNDFRPVGGVTLILGNIETGVGEKAGSSRWRNLNNLEAIFREGIADFETDLGQQLTLDTTPAATPTPSPSPDSSPTKTPTETKSTKPTGKAPVIGNINNTQLHGSYEETPHRYLLKAIASDPEGGNLTFTWKINCGYFVGSADGAQIEWRYDTPGECPDAVVTVGVKDNEGLSTEKTQRVF